MRHLGDITKINGSKIDPVDGWENWNPKEIWVPGNGGLGMKFVFDKVNEIYTDEIRY